MCGSEATENDLTTQGIPRGTRQPWLDGKDDRAEVPSVPPAINQIAETLGSFRDETATEAFSHPPPLMKGMINGALAEACSASPTKAGLLLTGLDTKMPAKLRKKRKARVKKPVPQQAVTQTNEMTEKGHRRSHVTHNYHDYSGILGDEDIPDSPQSPRGQKGGITSPFPITLHRMIDSAEEKGYSDVVSWQPHGRAFAVHYQDRFVKEVMPKYFRQTRFSSFQRQLSLYGFLRLTRKGADHGAYYHELFLRGMGHLCSKIQRTRVKGYGVRPASDPETEPDFWSMPFVGVAGVAEDSKLRGFAPVDAGTSFPSLGQAMPALSESFPVALPLMKALPAKPEPLPYPLRPLAMPPSFAFDLQVTNQVYPVEESGREEAHSKKLLQPRPIMLDAPSYHTTNDNTINSSSKGQGASHGSNYKEQEDLVAFLSDVELSSEEENLAYRNEESLGQIFEHTHSWNKEDVEKNKRA